MNNLVNLGWFLVMLVVPLIGVRMIHREKQSNKQNSYFILLLVELSILGIWLTLRAFTMQFGATTTVNEVFHVAPTTVYSEKENVYTEIGTTSGGYAKFSITGKGSFSAPLDVTTIKYSEHEERPTVKLTYYKLDSFLAKLVGIQGQVTDNKKATITIKVPKGSVVVSNSMQTEQGKALDKLINWWIIGTCLRTFFCILSKVLQLTKKIRKFNLCAWQ